MTEGGGSGGEEIYNKTKQYLHSPNENIFNKVSYIFNAMTGTGK